MKDEKKIEKKRTGESQEEEIPRAQTQPVLSCRSHRRRKKPPLCPAPITMPPSSPFLFRAHDLCRDRQQANPSSLTASPTHSNTMLCSAANHQRRASSFCSVPQAAAITVAAPATASTHPPNPVGVRYSPTIEATSFSTALLRRIKTSIQVTPSSRQIAAATPCFAFHHRTDQTAPPSIFALSRAQSRACIYSPLPASPRPVISLSCTDKKKKKC
jgi:hypothetical protein